MGRNKKTKISKAVRDGIVRISGICLPRTPVLPDWDEIEDKDWEDIKMAVYAAKIEGNGQSNRKNQGKAFPIGISKGYFYLIYI